MAQKQDNTHFNKNTVNLFEILKFYLTFYLTCDTLFLSVLGVWR